MSKATDKIDAVVEDSAGRIGAAFMMLCGAGSQFRSVTRFVSKDLRVRVSRRRGCPSEFHVTVGKPNYRERAYVKRCPGVECGLTMTTAAPTTRKRSKR